VNLHRTGPGASTRYDALMIDNLPAEAGRLRNIMAAGLAGGVYGFCLRQVDVAVPSLAFQWTVQFEPASALKVLYNAYGHWPVYMGTDGLSVPITWYTYPGVPSPTGNPKDICPDPTKEIRPTPTRCRCRRR
jgi:hypothetical protein